MANSADPDQLDSSLIRIYTVCKSRIYPGSAGQELNGAMEWIGQKMVYWGWCVGQQNNGVSTFEKMQIISWISQVIFYQ